ncbi:MAG: hypothetical protein J4400_02790 [Candidatus Aenigmarchaeota archaeon]|nr:hypothetical protein [Candidatus Aenigmarchaeota archaeon]
MINQESDYSRPEQLSTLFRLYKLSTQDIERYASDIGRGSDVTIRVNDIGRLRVQRDRFELLRDP